MSNVKPEQGIIVTDPRKEQVKFITHVLVSGFANGVVNLTLGTAQFSTPDCLDVVDDIVVSSRLRMDLYTVQTLHAVLGAILEKNTKPVPPLEVN